MQISYRPEIDGLRAVSIVAVVLFHLGVHGFGGGYTGVDVFFVISGFLITRLIWKAIRNGDFSFKEFYVRRARRIDSSVRSGSRWRALLPLRRS